MNTFKEENVENPYRYGALVGNWVEERFGKELAQKPETKPMLVTSAQHFHGKQSTLHYSQASDPEPEFDPRKVSQSGVDRHLFFGHGASQDEFEKRELRTSYELSMLSKVPAHQTVESHFIPPPLPEKIESAKPEAGPHQLKPKHYNQFTKRCDLTFNKIGLRK